jgi:hypothetical protein
VSRAGGRPPTFRPIIEIERLGNFLHIQIPQTGTCTNSRADEEYEMRVTKTQLRRIIKEEKRKVLAENRVRGTIRRALREYTNPGEVRDPNARAGEGSVVLSIFGNQSESIDEIVQAENYYMANRNVPGATWRWATPEETALLLPDGGTPHERALVLTGPWNDIVHWYWADYNDDLNEDGPNEYQAKL